MLLAVFFAPLVQAAAESPPNIVIILADDLGYGEVGFNGQNLISTPNIDEMAEQGVVFSSFYAGAPSIYFSIELPLRVESQNLRCSSN